MKKIFFCLTLLLTMPFTAHAKEYKIISPLKINDVMACWASAYPEYDQVIGYSSLGHIFMRNSENMEYSVLHPFKGAAKSYGQQASLQDFEDDILQDDGFDLFVLKSDHVEEIRENLGSLEELEVYIPEPYPFLGGDESVASYDKGNVWVMLAIVGEFLGVCS